RKGLGVTYSEPLYVIATNPYRNALVVGVADDLGKSNLIAHRVNWTLKNPPTEPFRAGVKIRYKAKLVDGLVTPLNNNRVHIQFDTPLRDITPGQGAVMYDGDVCLGGGIIIRHDD
ncbi:MAG: tRNA 2-thiouridine(34) synthase MnmA, partial [Phototrophicales bacterium]